MPCTADLERRDYLCFLPKRPQGTTKFLGTPAFAGTKTPAALKFPSKDATTDCVEPPVNCPHCGQKYRAERRFRRQPFILLSFSSSEKPQKRRKRSHTNDSNASVIWASRVSQTPLQTPIPYFHQWVPRGKKALVAIACKTAHVRFHERKRVTHSPLRKGSHTAAHTAKQGAFRTGRYHYPRHKLHVHEYPRAGYQNGNLCRFWVLVGVCSQRT